MSPERAARLLGKVGEDEPVFVLRAQDCISVPVLEKWLNLAVRLGVSPDKLERATVDLGAFVLWQKRNPTKVPD